MSVIVVDISSGSMIEAGFAGEDQQQVQIPCTAIAPHYVTDITQFKNDLALVFTALGVSSEGQRILLTTPGIAIESLENQQHVVTLLFETFKIDACILLHEALLTLYATGRESGIVVVYGLETILITALIQMYVQINTVMELPSPSSIELIADTIVKCIRRVHFDDQSMMAANIVVVGDGIPEDIVSELHNRLKENIPSQLYFHLKAPFFPDNCKNIIWKGGSMFGEQAASSEYFFTKAEYQANGVTYITQKGF